MPSNRHGLLRYLQQQLSVSWGAAYLLLVSFWSAPALPLMVAVVAARAT